MNLRAKLNSIVITFKVAIINLLWILPTFLDLNFIEIDISFVWVKPLELHFKWIISNMPK